LDKLVQVLVYGAGHARIADRTCSATTIRERRDEWIEAGIFDRLEHIALEAYDRLVGLDPGDTTDDGCIVKAPCGGEAAGRSPVDWGKQGTKRSLLVEATGIPIGCVGAGAHRNASPLLRPTLDMLARFDGHGSPTPGTPGRPPPLTYPRDLLHRSSDRRNLRLGDAPTGNGRSPSADLDWNFCGA
jgi:hypothetical protein